MPNKLRSITAAIFASVVLSACGGGSGSSDAEPKVVTPPPPADTKLVWDDESQKWDEAEWQ
ncbi:hypothetical protein RI844_05205 [Thalassotalea fonticola]|uniref:Uncharacterized protein n=1 Tax=Thalassotalea fonticola TaxID=3065649 RepID=A0ABZ0GSM4_9GAMM|nr:hypothetical protein RI844_05205 [Colwelliaceae bacterium S1-1]